MKKAVKLHKASPLPRKLRPSEEEIQRMIADADKYRGVDELKKEMIEYKNTFEKYLKTSQTTINETESQDALTLDERSYANQLILNTLDWLMRLIHKPMNHVTVRKKKSLIVANRLNII